MSNQITTALVEQFNTNCEHLFQQTRSQLESRVRRVSQRGLTEYFDQIGATHAMLRTVRHGDTQHVDTPHKRRSVMLEDYVWADLIDQQDRLRMLLDPTSDYLKSATMAFNRVKDLRLINAAIGIAKTSDGPGSGPLTDVALPASQIISVDYVHTGPAVNSGLTLAKLIEAKAIMERADVPADAKHYFVCTYGQIRNMLLQAQDDSDSNYTEVKALLEGRISNFMGFEFVTTNLVTKDTSTNIRQCFAYVEPALLLSVGEEIHSRVDELPTKHYAVQPYVSMSIGATRMQEAGVVQINCEEL